MDDSFTSKDLYTSKNLYTSGLCGHWIQSRRPARSDRWSVQMTRESRRTWWWWWWWSLLSNDNPLFTNEGCYRESLFPYKDCNYLKDKICMEHISDLILQKCGSRYPTGFLFKKKNATNYNFTNWLMSSCSNLLSVMFTILWLNTLNWPSKMALL